MHVRICPAFPLSVINWTPCSAKLLQIAVLVNLVDCDCFLSHTEGTYNIADSCLNAYFNPPLASYLPSPSTSVPHSPTLYAPYVYEESTYNTLCTLH